MQWHKAKVSIFLQKWSKFRTKIVHTKKILKNGGRDFEIKEIWRRWRDYLMYKIKSLELKRSDQMGSNPIDKNVNRNPEFPWTFRTKQHTTHTISTWRARHQIKIATSKLNNSMIFLKFTQVVDEFLNAISHRFKITASQWLCCRWTQMDI